MFLCFLFIFSTLNRKIRTSLFHYKIFSIIFKYFATVSIILYIFSYCSLRSSNR
ncbi:MAG: hypothetical protein K2N89_06775 [Lachnospiraceae bacterium]|nr:hypothetical protein [Lachnospiraceae bacterium]